MTDQQTLLAPAGQPAEHAEQIADGRSEHGSRKPFTASQALARFDATMRRKAAAVGAPTDRTACVGMYLPSPLARVIYTDAANRVQVLDLRDDSAPTPLTFNLLRTVMADAYDLDDAAGEAGAKGVAADDFHAAVVFADPSTLRRVATMSDTWGREKGTQEARGLSRLLAFRRALPFSVFGPVLTEALASRYWLPTGGQADDLSAWDTAFAHGKASTSREAFGYLVARALDGTHDAEILRSIKGSEKYGARAGQYGSDSAAASAFTKAGALTDAYAAMLSVDPTLRERNMLSGEVSKLRIHQIKADCVEAYLDDPGKMREGSKVLIFDGYDYGHKVEVTLKSVEFVDDRLMAVLSTPSERAAHGYLIAEAKKNHRPLYAAPAPFLMIKKAPRNKRWSNSADDFQSPQIEIPVDIILAGGPVA